MARVFKKPHFVDQDRFLYENAGIDPSATQAAEQGALDLWLEEEDFEIPTRNDRLAHRAAQTGMDRFEALTKIAAFIRTTFRQKTRLYDHDAVLDMWLHIISGDILVCDKIFSPYITVETTARECASFGMIGSFASPAEAAQFSKTLPLFKDLLAKHRTCAAAMALADAIRLNVVSKESSHHIRGVFSGTEELDEESCTISAGTVGEYLINVDCYALGPVTAFSFNDRVWILSKDTRDSLAQILWSSGMWVLASMSHLHPLAESCATAALEYVKGAVAVNNIEDRVFLARQMKSSYAVFLAEFKTKEATPAEQSLIKAQRAGLLAEAEGYRKAEYLWYAACKSWPEELKIDMGTAWNLLPAPDSDIALTNDECRRKFNAPREFNKEAWHDFIEYSRNAIVAHYLVKHKDKTVEWEEEDAESLEWVIKCRSGILEYPSKEDRRHPVRFLSWERHLETWGYTAQDVTHIYSDIKKYADPATLSETAQGGMSELTYYIKNGMILSGKWDPESIRECWKKGYIPGDRVLYEAVKSENTKVPGKQRETMSADDILRECLTEVDINLSKIGNFAHGVAMRAGRRGTEQGIKNVISGYRGNKLIVSLDVSGWSPNMQREGETAFIDMLLDMFDIPKAMRVSPIFRNINVVASRMGFHSTWEATDGSVQGFFGTGDTILHSCMAQWCFSRMKASGTIERGAKMAKFALIDDIVALLSNTKVDLDRVLEEFTESYGLLGFTADKTKTIAREHSGHFLNRFYYSGEEVITAHKIMARCDREWDRRWISVFDEIDSIFGSALGASDRGASPAAAYVIAMWRSMHRIHCVSRAYQDLGTEFSTISAWLPRSMCGAGIPSFAHWVTKEGALNLEAALSVPMVIADKYEEVSKPICVAIKRRVYEIASSPIDTPSPERFMDDPLNVKLTASIDPSNVLRSAARDCIKRLKPHAELAALMSVQDDPQYSALLFGFLKSAVYPSDIISQLSASLPHTVVVNLVEKMMKSDSILSRATAQAKDRIWKAFRASNVKACMFTRLVPTNRSKVMVSTASSLAELIRERQCTQLGVTVTGLRAPAASDLLRQLAPSTTEAGIHVESIKVYVPEVGPTNMLTAPYRAGKKLLGTVLRTRNPKSANVSINTTVRDAGPIPNAFRKAVSVAAMADVLGCDISAIKKVWSRAWTGRDNSFPEVTGSVESSNTQRVAQRFKMVNHTVAGYVNFASHVAVDANQLISRYDMSPKAFSWLTLVYFLKAAASLDAELHSRQGGTTEWIRRYVFSDEVDFYREDGAWASVNCSVIPEYRGYAGRAFASAMTEYAKQTVEIMSDDDDSDDDNVGQPEGTSIISVAKADSIVIKKVSLLRATATGTMLSLFAGGMFAPYPHAKTGDNTDVKSKSSTVPRSTRVASTNYDIVKEFVNELRAAHERAFIEETEYDADSGADEYDAYASIIREALGSYDSSRLLRVPAKDPLHVFKRAYEAIIDADTWPSKVLEIVKSLQTSWAIDHAKGDKGRQLVHLEFSRSYKDKSDSSIEQPVYSLHCKYLSMVTASWSKINDRDFPGAIHSILINLFHFINMLYARSKVGQLSSIVIEESLNEYRAHNYHPKTFFARCADILDDPKILRKDWKQYEDVSRALKSGVRRCHTWAVADFAPKYLKNAIAMERGAIKKAAVAMKVEDTSDIMGMVTEGIKMSEEKIAPKAEEHDDMDEIREYCRETGFAVPSPEGMEMWKMMCGDDFEFWREEKKNQTNADV